MRIPCIACATLIAASLASAQWLNYPTAGIPRTANGKANLSAPVPKKANGQPDLSGIWLVPGIKYLISIAADLKPGDVPFQPWAEAEYKKRVDNLGKDDPNNFCLPSIIPEKIAVTSPWKIVETPGVTYILYESRTIFRQIFTDGRASACGPESLLERLFYRANGMGTLWWCKPPVSRDGLARHRGHPVTDAA